MTCAMAGARRSVAAVAQLRASAPTNTMAPFATAESAKRNWLAGREALSNVQGNARQSQEHKVLEI